MSNSFWLCLHLDSAGHPCNRRTMKAAISERYCDEHREVPVQAPRRSGPTPEYQCQRRARIAQCGLSAAMEAA